MFFLFTCKLGWAAGVFALVFSPLTDSALIFNWNVDCSVTLTINIRSFAHSPPCHLLSGRHAYALSYSFYSQYSIEYERNIISYVVTNKSIDTHGGVIRIRLLCIIRKQVVFLAMMFRKEWLIISAECQWLLNQYFNHDLFLVLLHTSVIWPVPIYSLLLTWVRVFFFSAAVMWMLLPPFFLFKMTHTESWFI